MLKVPTIPMLKILKSYKEAHNIPLRLNRLEELIRCFKMYCDQNKKLN